jgi:Malectin domain
MGTRKFIRIGICLAAAAVALLSTASSASGQTEPIRYVFGTNSFTDPTGLIWTPVPTSYLSESPKYHWSDCSANDSFTGTTSPGLYKEQMAEDSGDLVLIVPVPSASYTVNIYFAEPCTTTVKGARVFGVMLNGTTIVPSLDLVATAGMEKSVIESGPANGTEIVLDLKRIVSDPLIAAIEILPASSSFQLTAQLKWDDGTPVTGTVVVAQETSVSPPTSNSLGSFALAANGTATGSLTPDLTLPLTFSLTLINSTGVIENTLTFSSDLMTINAFPHAVNASLVFSKSSGTVESFTF